VWGFGRALALWGFNAVQRFRADSDIDDLCRKVLIAALALMTCGIETIDKISTQCSQLCRFAEEKSALFCLKPKE
jgi:hypothetical protein